jgi:hypothetical protein
MMLAPAIFIGFDPREAAAFAVARASIQAHLNVPIPIMGLVLPDLMERGLYTRPTQRRLGRLYDDLSRRDDYDGAISTEFALSRFLVPHLAKEWANKTGQRPGWALFMDCDMLARADLSPLFRIRSETKDFAAMCVKHDHAPVAVEKMDGQLQTAYPRKNWSSFILFNCEHPANDRLTLEMINTLPGRDLHRLCWLEDDEIGELGVEWNWLAGHSDPSIDPKVVHHTDGSPCMAAFENTAYADEWRAVLAKWARPPRAA